ncbi:MAG: amidohydrolase [Candidatus Nezhaarchaeales archaeon]
MPESPYFVVSGGTLITMGPKGVIRDGLLAVEDGIIVDIGRRMELKGKYASYQRIDANGKIVMPGLVNAHTHAAMTLLRGYADDLPLKQWLEKWVWPLERHLTGYEIYVGALLASIESMLSGVTTINTMYHYYPDYNEAKAIFESGLRGAVGHVCFSWRKDFDKQALKALFTEWHGKEGRIRATVDPHAPYTVDPDYLQYLCELAEELEKRYEGVPVALHMHVAETEDEALLVSEAFNVKVESGIIKYLEKLGVLKPRLIAAHCVWLTDEEIEILRRRNVKVVHNPVSNLKLASGVSPIPKLLKAGVTIALGTDGACSNNSLDIFEAIKLTALLHKGVNLDPTLIKAEDAVKMATLNGARALLWEDKLGSLETGKAADFAILNFRKPHLTPLFNELSHLTYAVKSSDVETVAVNGKLILEDGKLKTVDIEKVMDEAEKVKEDLLLKVQAKLAKHSS